MEREIKKDGQEYVFLKRYFDPHPHFNGPAILPGSILKECNDGWFQVFEPDGETKMIGTRFSKNHQLFDWEAGNLQVVIKPNPLEIKENGKQYVFDKLYRIGGEEMIGCILKECNDGRFQLFIHHGGLVQGRRFTKEFIESKGDLIKERVYLPTVKQQLTEIRNNLYDQIPDVVDYDLKIGDVQPILKGIKRQLKALDQFIDKLPESEENALSLLRETTMRCNLFAPENEQDRKWFDEGYGIDKNGVFVDKLFRVLKLGNGVSPEITEEWHKGFVIPDTTNDQKAFEACQFYDRNANVLDNHAYFEKLTDLEGKGINMDQLRIYLRVGKSYSHSRFMQFVADIYGVSVDEMKEQWKNFKKK